MGAPYRQFPRRRGPVVPQPTQAPYLSYWVQPTNEPLKNRVPKRLQVNKAAPPFPAQPSGAPYVPYWKQPTNQPLRSRTPKRQQPNPWHVPFPAPPSAAPYLSYWKQPVNQPQRPARKARLITIPGGEYSALTEAPFVSYWIQDVNQPLRNRIPKRQQPMPRWNPWYATQQTTPSVAGWAEPVSQPERHRWIKRQQPPASHVPLPAQPSAAPYVSYWVQPVNQPLRSRVPKRQQPRYPGQFYPPIPSEPPYLSYWKQPTNQPRPPRKVRLVEISGGEYSAANAAPYLSYWKQPTEQPLRSRKPKRQQPIPIWQPWYATTAAPVAPILSSWVHPTNEPLRSRIPRRQQPAKAAPPFPPLASQAPYLSYWVHPTNEPLRNRIPKRQQPAPPQLKFPPQTSAAPYLSYWVQPTNEPLRARVPKRQQPKQAWNPWFATTTPPAAPILSSWKQPIQEPLRSRTPKRTQVDKARPPFPPVASAAPYLSYWVHPKEQPIRYRYLRRQQVARVTPEPPRASIAPYLSYWVQPVQQPLRRKMRSQPTTRWNAFYSIPAQSVAPSVASWKRPVEQPLRNRISKRLQVARTFVKFTCGWSFIQSKQTNTAGGTSLAIPMNQAMLVNDLAIVNIKGASGLNNIRVTDDAGNVYADTGARAGAIYQFYGVQTIGGATQVTVTWTNSVAARITVDEFSGGARTNASVFDKASTGSGTGTTSAVTAFSPFTTGELISAQVVYGGTVTAGTGYWLSQSNNAQATEYKTASDASETAPFNSTLSAGFTEIAGAYVPLCVQLTPKVATWRQPVEQPLKFRVPKRQHVARQFVVPPGLFFIPSPTSPQVLQANDTGVTLSSRPTIEYPEEENMIIGLASSATDERLSSEDSTITLDY